MTEEIKQKVFWMGRKIVVWGGVLFLILMILRGRIGPVLFGTLLGCVTAWGYFVILGLAVEKPENKVRFSLFYLARFTLIGLTAYWALTQKRIDPFGALIPLVFPHFIILFQARREQG